MPIYRIDTTVRPISGDPETIHFLIATTKEGLDVDALRMEAIESLQTLNKTGPNRFMEIGAPCEILVGVPLPDFRPIRDAIHTQTWVVHPPPGL
jgi:hypothetical protein